MSILRLEGVRREIGDFVILDGISVALARGERVGLVGVNGAGKTTLLEIMAGREEPDGGSVHLATGSRVGLLTQESHLDAALRGAPDVRRAVRAGAAQTEALERRLAELEGHGAGAVEGAEYAALRERFEALDGYHLDQRVDETLAGLGVPRTDWGRRLRELSGGEQTRVALARLLVTDPDVLLLDEPTNHLDVSALEWLEGSLGRRRGTLVVASHDRAFLDAVVTRTWELRDRRLSVFRGGYSTYLAQREAADSRLRREQASGEVAMAREQELIGRYRSQRKHTKMHEHERRLEQLRGEQVAAPRRGGRLALPEKGLLGGEPARSGEMVVSLQDVLCGFPAGAGHAAAGRAPVPVTRAERLEAMRGDRIGLVGPNGAGKTTLLRTVAGELAPLAGFVRLGAGVQPGYLAQLRDRELPGSTVLDALLAAAPVESGVARGYLARFLFRGEDAFKPVVELSGGERSRLELALLGVMAANLLLLDEPTNHLDIPAREALESFLRETPATLLLVSHDRRLLETVCQRLWVVEPGVEGEPGRVAPFEGGYREWRSAVAEGWTVEAELARRAATARPRLPGNGRHWSAAVTSGPSRTSLPSGGRPATPPTGRATQPGRVVVSPSGRSRAAALSKDAYRRQLQRVEEDLTRLGLRRSQLQLALSDPSAQANFVELRRLTSELADVDAALGQAEDAWLAISERAPR